MANKVIIDNISNEQWEEYAGKFADYSIYQTTAYQKVRAEKEGYKLSRAAVLDNSGDIVTMCHVRIKHIRPAGLRVGYIQWGPLLRLKNNIMRCDPETLKELVNCYFDNHINVLRIVPNICDDDFGKKILTILEAAGFCLVEVINPYLTMMIKLEGSENDIRSRIHRSWRRYLNRAENNNMNIRQGPDGELFNILKQIYVSAQNRKGFKGLDPDIFIKTQNLLHDTVKMNTIVAFSDGQPLTAHSTSHLGDIAVGILAGSNEKGLELGSSYLVWWQTLLAAKRSGMLKYDLGGIDPVNNPEVHQYKLRMGAEEVKYIGTFDICSSRLVSRMWRACESLYRLIRR